MRRLLLIVCVALVASASQAVVQAKPDSAIKELAEKRTASSKTWQNADGSMTAEIFTKPIHYRDGDGNWQDIDTFFGPPAKSWCRRSITKNPMKVHVGRKQSIGTPSIGTLALASSSPEQIELETEGGSLSFSPDAASFSEPVINGNKMAYADVWPSVDLNYTVGPTGLKEDIILKRRLAVAAFRFTISHAGLTVDKQTNGPITFTNADGIECFFVPAAYMIDADGHRSNAVSLSMESASEGSTVMCITPDPTWLAQAHYPVVVDPSFTNYSIAEAGYIEQLTANPPGVWHHSSYGDGNPPKWTMHIASGLPSKTTYIQWNMTGMVPVSVSSATIKFSAASGLGTVGMRKVTSPWTPVDGQLVYSPPSVDPDPDGLASGTWTSEWTSSQITALVEDWLDGSCPNYGIEIRGLTLGDKTFCDDYDTSLSITYNYYDDDTTPPTTPCVISPTLTSNTQIGASWSESTDSETGMWQYSYCIGTAPGVDNIVNWTPVAITSPRSATKTGLSLASGVDYYFSVKARDKAGNWSPAGCSPAMRYSGGKIIYVNAAGIGGDGLSWQNAKKTLGEGTTAASAGDQVWVAAGEYTGSLLPKAGVAYYGGFPVPGIEHPWPTMEDRDPKANISKINRGGTGQVVYASGSPGAIKLVDGFSIVNGSYGIYCYGATLVVSNNVIEGQSTYAITAGTAGSLPSSIYIVGNEIKGNSGSGVVSCSGTDTAATITDNIITDNQSTMRTAGIYLSGTGSKTFVVSRNTIKGNSTTVASGDIGYGIHCSFTNAVITANRIENNSAVTSGGGIYFAGSTTLLESTIANNIIANNTTTAATGGGIFVSSMPYDRLYGRALYLTNNTIVGNSNSCIYSYNSSPLVFNNILASSAKGVNNVGTGAPTGQNNLVADDIPLANAYIQASGIAPMTPGTSDLAPGFDDQTAGSYHLLLSSPCVNAGCNNVKGMQLTDIDGESRRSGSPASTVDIGADEFTPMAIIPSSGQYNYYVGWAKIVCTVPKATIYYTLNDSSTNPPGPYDPNDPDSPYSPNSRLYDPAGEVVLGVNAYFHDGSLTIKAQAYVDGQALPSESNVFKASAVYTYSSGSGDDGNPDPPLVYYRLYDEVVPVSFRVKDISIEGRVVVDANGDVVTPATNKMSLQWGGEHRSTYTLKRKIKGSTDPFETVVTGSSATSLDVTDFSFNTSYTYELTGNSSWDSAAAAGLTYLAPDADPGEAGVRMVANWPEATSTFDVTPMSITASENQAVDSREDTRKEAPTLLNVKFEDSAYRGGLFVGYAGAKDESKIGRSLLKFTVPSLPSASDRLWASNLSVYHNGIRQANTFIDVGCHYTPDDSWSALSGTNTNCVTWSTAPFINPIKPDATLRLDPANPPDQWRSWTSPSLFRRLIDEMYGQRTLSFVMASTNESAEAWTYFRKAAVLPNTAPQLLYVYGSSSYFVTDFTLDKSTVIAGNPAYGTVKINAPAPSGGLRITFKSDGCGARFSDVNVPQGAMSARVVISTPRYGWGNVNITPTLGDSLYEDCSRVLTLQ